jgi:hypothetical protein
MPITALPSSIHFSGSLSSKKRKHEDDDNIQDTIEVADTPSGRNARSMAPEPFTDARFELIVNDPDSHLGAIIPTLGSVRPNNAQPKDRPLEEFFQKTIRVHDPVVTFGLLAEMLDDTALSKPEVNAQKKAIRELHQYALAKQAKAVDTLKAVAMQEAIDKLTTIDKAHGRDMQKDQPAEMQKTAAMQQAIDELKKIDKRQGSAMQKAFDEPDFKISKPSADLLKLNGLMRPDGTVSMNVLKDVLEIVHTGKITLTEPKQRLNQLA